MFEAGGYAVFEEETAIIIVWLLAPVIITIGSLGGALATNAIANLWSKR